MKFRKKPVVIEAVQWLGNNQDELLNFVGSDDKIYWSTEQISNCDCSSVLIIKTLEGNMTALIGDWIIRGIQGELYPCKPDIFEKTYEKVE